MLYLPPLYTPELDDTVVVPIVLIEELTDEEARAYADSITSEQAREHLEALMNASIV